MGLALVLDGPLLMMASFAGARVVSVPLGSVPCEESKSRPAGACKVFVILFVNTTLVVELCELLIPFSSVLPFEPHEGLVLCADRSQSQGGFSRRWYARSRCRGQGQEVSDRGPVRAPESRCSGGPPWRSSS